VNHVMQALVNSEATLAVDFPVRHVTNPLRERPRHPPRLARGARDGGRRHDAADRRGARKRSLLVNNLSIGLYPDLVSRREEHGRDYPRWKARLLAAFGTLRKYPHVTLTIESEHHQEVVRTHVFMVSNNRYDLSRIGVEAPRELMTEEGCRSTGCRTCRGMS